MIEKTLEISVDGQKLGVAPLKFCPPHFRVYVLPDGAMGVDGLTPFPIMVSSDSELTFIMSSKTTPEKEVKT